MIPESLKRNLSLLLGFTLLASCTSIPIYEYQGCHKWKKVNEASKTYNWYKRPRWEIDILCGAEARGCILGQYVNAHCEIVSIYSIEEAEEVEHCRMSHKDHEIKHCRGYIHL